MQQSFKDSASNAPLVVTDQRGFLLSAITRGYTTMASATMHQFFKPRKQRRHEKYTIAVSYRTSINGRTFVRQFKRDIHAMKFRDYLTDQLHVSDDLIVVENID